MTDRTRELECVIADLTREAKELRAELEALKRQEPIAYKHRDGMLSAAPQPERAASNPIGVEAVCVVVDGLDGKRIDWLIEGGLADLPEGTTLIFAHQAITGADGWGEVFLAAPQPEHGAGGEQDGA